MDTEAHSAHMARQRRGAGVILAAALALPVLWQGYGAAQCAARGGDPTFGRGGVVCHWDLGAR